MLPYMVRESWAPGAGELTAARDQCTNDKRRHVGAVCHWCIDYRVIAPEYPALPLSNPLHHRTDRFYTIYPVHRERRG